MRQFLYDLDAERLSFGTTGVHFPAAAKPVLLEKGGFRSNRKHTFKNNGR